MKPYSKSQSPASGTPVWAKSGPYLSPRQQAIKRSSEITDELKSLSNAISSRIPIYKSQQEADAEINATVYNKYTKDRQTYSAAKQLDPIVIKASDTPDGYRSDNQSMREDLLKISPILHSKVPRKYDRYKISDRISYEAPAVDPSTQGLITSAKQIAIEAPMSIAPLPFSEQIEKGLGYVGKKILQSIDIFDNKAKTVVSILNNGVKENMQNAYKINPFAFKPDANAYYRGIGRTGYDDAIESGLIRLPENSGYDAVYFTDKFDNSIPYSRNQSYAIGDPFDDIDWKMIEPKDPKSYIAEIPKSKIKDVGSEFENNIFGYYSTKDPIYTKDVKIYKENWLRRYKEIKPKKR